MAANPATVQTPPRSTPAAPVGRLATWRYILNTANLPEVTTHPDVISKWLGDRPVTGW